MRVLHVIPSLSLTQGGPSFVLPIMERALSREGVEVETVTTDDGGRGRRSGSVTGVALTENGVVRRYFPKQIEFYKVSFRLARWLSHEVARYDLVHIHALFSHSSVSAASAAAKSGVPYVIRPLGVLNQYGIRNRRAFLKGLSLKWIEGPLLTKAAAIQFTSEAEMTEAEQLAIPFRGVVIPLGLESLVAPDSGAMPDESVLFLSRIDPKKNIEGLLEAWAKVIAAFPGWTLKIAGRGAENYEHKLRRIAFDLGIESSIIWTGQVEGDEKARLLREASVFVLPSHSENFGIAAAEALFAGKACVFTSGVAVGAAAIQRGAAMESGTDGESIAESLRKLFESSALRAELGSKGRQFAEEELSAATMGRRLRELYESIRKI